MKLFLLGILLLVSTARASNWLSPRLIGPYSGTVSGYQLQKDCGPDCLDVGDDLEMLKAGKITIANDWGAETDSEQCSDEADCTAKLASKDCGDSSKFIDSDYSHVYCSKLLGKILVKDQAGWDAIKLASAQKAALEAGIAMATSLRQCGERVMALMLVRNQPKGLTSAQVKQLVAGYSQIKSLLESGSLKSAKEEIQAVTADGILVTEADKTALTQEIDKCLGVQ